MIYRFTSRVDIRRGDQVGIDAGGKLCLTLPHVTEGVGVACRDIKAGEEVTFSHDEDTDVRSFGILISE